MHRRANATFARLGATADHFVLLTELVRTDGVTQAELVRRCHSDPNTVRAVLVLLERRGLVTRMPHAHDGRARCVVLTEAGRRLQADLWQAVDDVHANFEAAFAPDEQAVLNSMLVRVAACYESAADRSAANVRIARDASSTVAFAPATVGQPPAPDAAGGPTGDSP